MCDPNTLKAIDDLKLRLATGGDPSPATQRMPITELDMLRGSLVSQGVQDAPLVQSLQQQLAQSQIHLEMERGRSQLLSQTLQVQRQGLGPAAGTQYEESQALKRENEELRRRQGAVVQDQAIEQ